MWVCRLCGTLSKARLGMPTPRQVGMVLGPVGDDEVAALTALLRGCGCLVQVVQEDLVAGMKRGHVKIALVSDDGYILPPHLPDMLNTWFYQWGLIRAKLRQ